MTNTPYEDSSTEILLSDHLSESRIEKIIRNRLFGHNPGECEDFDLNKLVPFASALSSADYMMKHMSHARQFETASDLHRAMLEGASNSGLYLEFGVYSGWSINLIADQKPQQTIFGFDSFEGLPDKWRDGYEAGHFARDTFPEVRSNVKLIKGWFNHTLPLFLDHVSSIPVSYLHVDCDMYSSSVTIFNNLQKNIVPGTIIIFDEYFNYPYWEHHEFKAFQEYISSSGRKYKYVGVVPRHQQVAVQIIG